MQRNVSLVQSYDIYMLSLAIKYLPIMHTCIRHTCIVHTCIMHTCIMHTRIMHTWISLPQQEVWNLLQLPTQGEQPAEKSVRRCCFFSLFLFLFGTEIGMFLSQTDPVFICLMILNLLSTWNSLLQINRCDLTRCFVFAIVFVTENVMLFIMLSICKEHEK